MAVDVSQLDPTQVIQSLDPTNAITPQPVASTPNLSATPPVTDAGFAQLSGDTYAPAAPAAAPTSLDSTAVAPPSLVGQGSSISTGQLGNLGIVQQQTPQYFNSPQEILADMQKSPPAPIAKPQGIQYFGSPQDVLNDWNKSNTPSATQAQGQPQYGSGLAGSVLNAENQLPGDVRAFVHTAQGQLAPTAAGFGIQTLLQNPLTGFGKLIGGLFSAAPSVAQLGEAGAAVAAAAPEEAAAEAVDPAGGGLIAAGVTFLASLGLMWATNWAAQQGQDAITKSLVPEQDRQLLQQQMSQESQQYPGYAFAGSMAPQALFLRPGLNTLKNAYSGAAKLIVNPRLSTAMGLLPDEKQALLNVALGAGFQGGSQVMSGDTNPYRIGASILFGGLFSTPTRLSQAVGALGDRAFPIDPGSIQAGQEVGKSIALPSLEKSLLEKITKSPAEADALRVQLKKLEEVRNADPAQQANIMADVENGIKAIDDRATAAPSTAADPLSDWYQKKYGINITPDELHFLQTSSLKELGDLRDEGILTPEDLGSIVKNRQFNIPTVTGPRTGAFAPPDLVTPEELSGARQQRAGGVNWNNLTQYIARNGGVKVGMEDLNNGWIFPNQQAVDTVAKDHYAILKGGPVKTDPLADGAIRVSSYGGERLYEVANIRDINSLGLLELKIAVDANRSALGDVFSIHDSQTGRYVQFTKQDFDRYNGNIIELLNRAGRNQGASLRDARFMRSNEAPDMSSVEESTRQTFEQGRQMEPVTEDQIPLTPTQQSNLENTRQTLEQGKKLQQERMVNLYHGTTNKGLEGITKEGTKALDLHRLTNEIEVALGLNPNSIWDSGLDKSRFSTSFFPRIRQGSDWKNKTFYSTHPDTAAAYAKRFGEATDDILTAAYNITHKQHRFISTNDKSMLKWKAEIADQLGLTPMVAEFQVPESEAMKLVDSRDQNGLQYYLNEGGEHLVDLPIEGGIPSKYLTQTTDARDVSKLRGSLSPLDHLQGSPSPSDFLQGENYGIQSQTARFQKGTGETSQIGQAGGIAQGSEAGQASTFGSTGAQATTTGTANEPTGTIGRTAGSTAIGTTNVPSDFNASSFVTRSSTASQLGTTYAEEQGKTGTSGWASTSNLGDFRTRVSAAANSIGADTSVAPFNPNVRLLPEEHAALQSFVSKPNNRGIKGEAPINRAALFIPDDPRLAPPVVGAAEEWKGLTKAKALISELNARGITVADIPTGIKDDATRVALILKGWDKRFWYDNARQFVNTINWNNYSPGARERFLASLAVFGDRASVYDNARGALLHHSRMEQEVYASDTQNFDPLVRRQLIDLGIVPAESYLGGPAEDNLILASNGQMPQTQKLGDYAGAIAGEARAPVDMWNTRFSYGINNTPTSKIYDYEFGRRNYLTRMFSAHDPSILPSHIQMAEWYGYQRLVSERMGAAVKAAMNSGDESLIAMAKGLRADLESKDLAEVMQSTFGANGNLPLYDWDRLVGKYRNEISDLASRITVNYLKGNLGDGKDIITNQESIKYGLLSLPKGIRKELADYWQKWFVNPSNDLEAGKVNVQRTIGDSGRLIAQIAHGLEYPAEVNKELQAAKDVLGEIDLPKRDIPATTRSIRNDLPDVVRWSHNVLGIPQGIFGSRLYAPADEMIGAFGYYTPVRRNTINVNDRLADYLGLVQNHAASKLEGAANSPQFSNLQGYAAEKFKQAAAELALGTDLTARQELVVHEMIHGVTDRFKGWEGELGLSNPDQVALTMMKDAVTEPGYLEGLVHEGLGYEVESLIYHVTNMLGKAQTLNEYLGGVKGAGALKERTFRLNVSSDELGLESLFTGQIMPIREALDTLLEHQNYQYMQYLRDAKGKDIPHAWYSMASEETYRRNVYEPEIAEASYKRLGRIYDRKIAEVSDNLALEAETQRGGRGPNPAINSSLPTVDESTAGIAAYSRLPEARALQSGASGWGDAFASDQGINQSKLLDQGERVLTLESAAEQLRSKMAAPNYQPNDGDQQSLDFLEAKIAGLKRGIFGSNSIQGPGSIPDTSLLHKTQAAAQLEKLPGETPLAYAQRVIRASNVYQSLDHAVGLLKASQDGLFATEIKNGEVYTKVPGTNTSYKGTPSEMINSWHPGFKGIVDESIGFLKQHEADSTSPTNIDNAQLRESFNQEHAIPVSVRAKKAPKPEPEDKNIPDLTPQTIDALGKMYSAMNLSDNNILNQINYRHQNFTNSMDQVENVGDQGIFDPESMDPSKVAADALEAEQGLTPVQRSEDSGSNETSIQPTGRGLTPAQKKLQLKTMQKADLAASLRNFTLAFSDSRKLGDQGINNVANGVTDLLTHLFKVFDANDWQKDPRTWSDDTSNLVRAFSSIYEAVDKDLGALINSLPGGANERIRQAMDVKDRGSYLTALNGLSDQERAITELLHNYWSVLGGVGLRSGVLKSYLENYIPHIVVKDSQGKVPIDGRGKYSARTQHAIGRIRDEHGDLGYASVEELQNFLNEPKYTDQGEQLSPWSVKTNLGSMTDSNGEKVSGIFGAQGRSLVQAVLMKSTVNRLQELEINVGNGVTAKPVASKAYWADLPPEVQKNFISSNQVVGKWKNVLTRQRFTTGGNKKTNITEEPLMIWKPLADQMSREATLADTTPNPIVNFIVRANSWFKQYKFVSPVHIYSLLSNLSTMSPRVAGSRMASVPLTMHTGRDIVEAKGIYPNHNRMFDLIRAGLPVPEETVPENMGDVSRILDKMPGMRAFHDLLWRKTGYYGLVGLTDRLSKEYEANWIQKGNSVSDADRLSFDREAAYQAKKAMGYLSNLDMSKDWNLYGNVFLLANRWTTGQLRSLGDAFGIKYLSNLGTGSGLYGLAGTHDRIIEGTSPEVVKYMQQKNVAMARRLVWGGMARLAITSLIMSTAVSSLLNNGVPYTPIQNFQKDPNHTFDIYAGQSTEPDGTSHDNWIRNPFFLFQREMLDWAMAGVKAFQNGLPTVSADSLGGSIVGAPFGRFAGKLNPIFQLGIELPLNQELSMWMRGYSNSQISSDKYITNLQKSLDNLGVPDFGTVEQRLLYAMRTISPTPPMIPGLGLNFPTNLKQPTKDPMLVLNALGLGGGALGLPPGQALTNAALSIAGSRMEPGQTYNTATGMSLAQETLQSQHKTAIGQQILALAQTLGTGGNDSQTIGQMLGLAQSINMTPGQLAQVIGFGDAHSSGLQGLVYSGAPTSAAIPSTKSIGGVPITPQQDALYNEVANQRELIAIAQMVGDPSWASMGSSERIAEANTVIQFANKITTQQFGQSIGRRQGTPITNAAANQMIVNYIALKKQFDTALTNSTVYKAADPQTQGAMRSDRSAVIQNALWSQQFGALKGSTNYQIRQYIDLTTSLRDEVRQQVPTLTSYKQALSPDLQSLILQKGLTYADTLVLATAEGKFPKGVTSPLNQQQLFLAVKNGVALSDIALSELHNTALYQEAVATDQTGASANTLDSKYITLAHSIAIADMRHGVSSTGTNGFDNAIRTELAADQAYQGLVDEYLGGTAQLVNYQNELSSLKAQFRQDNSIPPSQLSKYDTAIDNWYYSRNPNYYAFIEARKAWEKYTNSGQAYLASTQASLGFESTDSLMNTIPPA